jgi:hypothetical protein
MQTNMRSLVVRALLALVPAGCGAPTATELEPLHVLFIGNSLTEVNDVPGLVAAIGMRGGREVTVAASIQSGTSLEDQWQIGEGRGLVAEGGWDYVVLQQGPSSLPESRTNLIMWTGVWDVDIRAVGAVTALYAVWPEEERSNVFPDVSANYQAAATSVDGVFLPAGDAWLAAWSADPSLELYGPDRFHPSALGSLLAALTIYGGLTGSVPDLEAGFEVGGVALSGRQARTLVEAARTALRDR